MFSKKSPGWTVEGYGYVRIFTKLKFQQLHNPPLFQYRFSWSLCHSYPEWWHVVEADTQRPDFSLTKTKQGSNKPNEVHQNGILKVSKAIFTRHVQSVLPRAVSLTRRNRSASFVKGAWHESFQKSPRWNSEANFLTFCRKPRLDGRWDEFNKTSPAEKNINRLPQMWYVSIGYMNPTNWVDDHPLQYYMETMGI